MTLLVFIGALIPRLATAGTFITIDEALWMRRSERFSDALTSFNLKGMSASFGEPATMPGVPTMWLGSIGRLFWGIGKSIGLIDDTLPFGESYKALAVAQVVVCFATAALIALLFYLIRRWLGFRAAVLTAVLFAFEPWIVGLGSILHVDDLSALFGTIALVCTAMALGLPEAVPGLDKTKTALLAGAMMAGALLTKVSSLGFAFGVAVLVGYGAFLAFRRGGRQSPELVRIAKMCGYALATLIAVTVVAWPALVVDPSTQIDALRTSTGLRSAGHPEFLLGELGFSRLFYLINVPFRLTPWGLLFLVIGVVAAVAQRKTRGLAIALIVGIAPTVYELSTATKRFPRYAVLFLFPLFVVSALGSTWPSLRIGKIPRRAITAVGAFALVYALFVAPYGLAYFNPALGGSKTALKNVPVGWGEGLDLAGERIKELAGGSCAKVTTQVGTPRLGQTPYEDLHWPCMQPASDGRSTYFVYYVSELQKATPLEKRIATRGRTFVESVPLRGIEYAEIWILDPEDESNE
ncbi:MAG: hypothetical protein KA110_01545 [Acidimicrobiia bacterium]|nr:hypothetical protein [Acidimicrobiia bacterium]